MMDSAYPTNQIVQNRTVTGNQKLLADSVPLGHPGRMLSLLKLLRRPADPPPAGIAPSDVWRALAVIMIAASRGEDIPVTESLALHLLYMRRHGLTPLAYASTLAKSTPETAMRSAVQAVETRLMEQRVKPGAGWVLRDQAKGMTAITTVDGYARPAPRQLSTGTRRRR
jgi:hypothetical protein